MNTNATSMDVEAEEGTIAEAYQDYLAENDVQDDSLEIQAAFYAGAKALLYCANPLSKMAALHAEIDEFFDAQ